MIIEFKKILPLVQRKVISNYQFVNVFVNRNEITTNYKIVGLQYYTDPQMNGQKLAAGRITSFFKMIFSKRFYKNLKNLLTQVHTIQRYWRMCL